MKILNEDTGVIIQARSLSKRLPNKLFIPFYRKYSIIDLVIRNILSELTMGDKIILATSKNPADDIFEGVADNYNLKLFRGDENNVLLRFVEAAETYNLKTIIRVCADNPLYDFNGTLRLYFNHKNKDFDYTSYLLSGNVPSIRSHLGFWGEVVSLDALKKVMKVTGEQFYKEHVTNYIYSHPDEFNINFIKAPSILYNRKDIRLTVDTFEDFKTVQKIYSDINGMTNKISIKNIVNYIDNNNDVLEKMKEQIIRNRK